MGWPEDWYQEAKVLYSPEEIAQMRAEERRPLAFVFIAVVENETRMVTSPPLKPSASASVLAARLSALASPEAIMALGDAAGAGVRRRVPRTTAAVDAGLIINPDGLANQIEGGIVQSVSWTLKEEVRFDHSGILTRDWASYPILTMPEAPKVELELINRPNDRPLGVGEGSQGPAAAAVVNAFASATGKRIRDLPLNAARVKAALG